ncbi:hypothetical protein JG688_00014357 [Phytophthora aleatoria]|uniref:Ubiquitin-like protease family profile domain-containing protein n=1 Tax=Phytophthora aleatoria TaxID=2496075 RepID=A0A8J5J0M6_9STRA|nr:hypothetical protein JG688_00014357 [Phytophthora aleatoria]
MDKSDGSLKQRGIGGVNPLYARMADDSIKRSVIESTLPFEKGNKFVLVPMNFEAHWSGVVFNFMDKMLVFSILYKARQTTELWRGSSASTLASMCQDSRKLASLLHDKKTRTAVANLFCYFSSVWLEASRSQPCHWSPSCTCAFGTCS